jgi:hypothetical protein
MASKVFVSVDFIFALSILSKFKSELVYLATMAIALGFKGNIFSITLL